MDSTGDILILGGMLGSIHLLELTTGNPLYASHRGADHEGPVTALATSRRLQHFVTGGQDGFIKVCTPPDMPPRVSCCELTICDLFHGVAGRIGLK